MRIALINENSQAAKNAAIEAALKKVVTPMGHQVDNYGMYGKEGESQLTYVQNGILAAILLNSGAANAHADASISTVKMKIKKCFFISNPIFIKRGCRILQQPLS